MDEKIIGVGLANEESQSVTVEWKDGEFQSTPVVTPDDLPDSNQEISLVRAKELFGMNDQLRALTSSLKGIDDQTAKFVGDEAETLLARVSEYSVDELKKLTQDQVNQIYTGGENENAVELAIPNNEDFKMPTILKEGQDPQFVY